MFNQIWSRNGLLLRIGLELSLSLGCVVVLLSNAGNPGVNYPHIPQSLAAIFHYVLWGAIIATTLSATGDWRKLLRLKKSD